MNQGKDLNKVISDDLQQYFLWSLLEHCYKTCVQEEPDDEEENVMDLEALKLRTTRTVSSHGNVMLLKTLTEFNPFLKTFCL